MQHPDPRNVPGCSHIVQFFQTPHSTSAHTILEVPGAHLKKQRLSWSLSWSLPLTWRVTDPSVAHTATHTASETHSHRLLVLIWNLQREYSQRAVHRHLGTRCSSISRHCPCNIPCLGISLPGNFQPSLLLPCQTTAFLLTQTLLPVGIART